MGSLKFCHHNTIGSTSKTKHPYTSITECSGIEVTAVFDNSTVFCSVIVFGYRICNVYVFGISITERSVIKVLIYREIQEWKGFLYDWQPIYIFCCSFVMSVFQTFQTFFVKRDSTIWPNIDPDTKMHHKLFFGLNKKCN